ncbi:unnamed protein product [Symbiodinium sp. CCMP2592]|nr:unnamed protein product [Symbiodinium sp. CCMP2592]
MMFSVVESIINRASAEGPMIEESPSTTPSTRMKEFENGSDGSSPGAKIISGTESSINRAGAEGLMNRESPSTTPSSAVKESENGLDNRGPRAAEKELHLPLTEVAGSLRNSGAEPNTNYADPSGTEQTLQDDVSWLLNLTEIGEEWIYVLMDCVIALCSIIPPLSFPASYYLFLNYGKDWICFRMEREREEEHWVPRPVAFFVRVAAEVTLWLWLLQIQYRAISDAIRFCDLLGVRNIHDFLDVVSLKEKTWDVDLIQSIIRYTQVNFMRSSLCVASVFCWRSFEVRSDRVRRSVKMWLEQTREGLEGTSRDTLEVIQELEAVKALKPYFEESVDPNHADFVRKECWSNGHLLKTLVSSVLMLVGLFLLALDLEFPARNRLFGDFDQAAEDWWTVNIFVASILTAHSWVRLLFAIFDGLDRFRDSIVRVLVVACLHKLSPARWLESSRGVESFTPGNRRRAKELVEALEGDQCQKRRSRKRWRWCLGQNLEEPVSRLCDVPALQKLTRGFATVPDLQVWWGLREYLRINMAYVTARMEFVGVMTCVVGCVFFVYALLDLLLGYNVISIGLALIYSSALPFLWLMMKILQYGMDINSMLSRDAKILAEAATWAACFPRKMRPTRCQMVKKSCM